jgi:CheY-like chemotaxis protein
MDYRLADGGDGLAAARRIREAGDIPIVFCTAYAHCLRPEILSVLRAQLIAKPVRLSCPLKRGSDSARGGAPPAMTSVAGPNSPDSHSPSIRDRCILQPLGRKDRALRPSTPPPGRGVLARMN